MAIVTAQAPLPTTIPVQTAPAPKAVTIPSAKLDETQSTTAAPAIETKDTPVEVKDDKLAAAYATIAKREKELRRVQQQIQADKQALKTKEEEYQKSYVAKDRLQKDPLTVLMESGLTQDQLVNMILNQQTNVDPTILEMQKQVKLIQDAQLNTEKTIKENQQKAYERAVNQIRKDTEALVASNADYETIKETNSTEAVVELIKQTFDEDGVLLSVQEAAKQVEDFLLEDALKMAGLKKVREKLTPQEVVEKAAEELTSDSKQTLADAKAKAPQQTQLKTLTNAATAASSKPLSNRDRRERAIAAFRGQLT